MRSFLAAVLMMFAVSAFAAQGDRTITFTDAVVTLSASKACGIPALVEEATKAGIEFKGGSVKFADGSKRELCWVEGNGAIFFVDESGLNAVVPTDVAEPIIKPGKAKMPKVWSM